MTRGELGLSDIRDFTTLFYVILRPKFSEWLELCIDSVSRVTSVCHLQYGALTLPLMISYFLQLCSNTLSSVRTGY